ncbi:MAG: manganese efflux pump MntP family protein [Bacteroidales bacterium]|nr:manganese efflux pump MntP family protein [Bacteroidales bacterium]HNW73455.1 manganese efflux pump MntP family protein [Bacteroidales bacterium]HPS49396.1 manganese efflux pump MntP family protein [Bacteroidales bacterium]
MNFTELLLISLGLSMDCFAVAISFGSTRKMTWKTILIMAFFFGLFQGLMPISGWIVGSSFQSMVETFDHWIAFSILTFIGIKMIIQSFRAEHEKNLLDIRKISVILSLAVATSIDALITGISFGFIKVNILEAAAVISIITFMVSVVGVKLGEKANFIPSAWAERIGGLVLIGIGMKILFEHLLPA